MGEKKESKKKWPIILACLLVLLVVGVATTVAVVAALNANVSNDFNVSYVAQNVKASIDGKYRVTDATSTDLTVGGENENIVFVGTESATDSTNNKKFDAISDIQLKAKDYVVFEYVIENTDNRANGVDFKVSLQKTNNTQMTNLEVEYLTSATEKTVDDETAMSVLGNSAQELTTLNANETTEKVYVYVRISIVNEIIDANFSGGLTFTLESIEE